MIRENFVFYLLQYCVYFPYHCSIGTFRAQWKVLQCSHPRSSVSKWASYCLRGRAWCQVSKHTDSFSHPILGWHSKEMTWGYWMLWNAGIPSCMSESMQELRQYPNLPPSCTWIPFSTSHYRCGFISVCERGIYFFFSVRVKMYLSSVKAVVWYLCRQACAGKLY